MPRVAITELQRRGALSNGWGHYDFRAQWNGSIRYGLPAVGKGLASLGLGVTCPEGSRDVNGQCECYSGRVWMPDRSKCVSPQSPAYIQAVGGGSTTHADQSSMTSKQWGQQSLTDASRRYIESQGHTIRCQIDPNWVASPAGGDPAMLCSIDGGPLAHAAYAINQNPYVALLSATREQAVETLGLPGGGYTTPEGQAAVQAYINTGQVDAGAVATAQEAAAAKQQLHDSLVPGVDYDVATGAPISWRAQVAGSNRITLDLIREALALPAGATLQDPTGQTNQQAYQGQGQGGGGGQTANGGGDGFGFNFSADGIPWWVWVGGAGAAFLMLKGK